MALLDASNIRFPLHQSQSMFHLEGKGIYFLLSPDVMFYLMCASENWLRCLTPLVFFSVKFHIWRSGPNSLSSLLHSTLQWETLLQMDSGKSGPGVPEPCLGGQKSYPSFNPGLWFSHLGYTKMLMKLWHLWATREEARDQPCILMDTSQICCLCTTTGTPPHAFVIFSIPLHEGHMKTWNICW